jgi:creatinine amidohydrolase
MSYCDERSTSPEVVAARPAFAVLPVGALEQHGPHLPLVTDTIIAAEFGHRLAAELGGLVLPAIPYGTSYEHLGFAGTVTLRWQTLATVVSEVVAGCWQQGISLVFVLSGHGGNFVLNPCVRDLNASRPAGCRAVLIPESVVFGDRPAGELHASRPETAMMMAFAPDLVHADRAVDFVPDVARAELTNVPVAELSVTGVWGTPTGATRDEGEGLVARRLDRLCDYARHWVDERAGCVQVGRPLSHEEGMK